MQKTFGFNETKVLYLRRIKQKRKFLYIYN